MILKFNNDEYDCVKAIKGKDYITAFNNEGAVVSFSGISDFSGFTLTGGEFSEPEPTKEELLEIQMTDLQMAVAELYEGGLA